MKRILYLLFFFCVHVILFVGCISELPSAYVIRRSHAPQHRYIMQDRDDGCVPIVKFDPSNVFARSNSAEPLLWTFGVNFEILSPDGNPVGCLRLYQRDETTGSSQVITIDDGGILVDTCGVYNTSGVTSTSAVRLGNGQADFTGEGFIQCEMDLGRWVTSLSGTLSTLPTAPNILTDFGGNEVHNYENFTMIARLQVDSPPPGPDPRIPIMSYISTSSTPFPTPLPITFSIAMYDTGEGLTAPVEQCANVSPQPSYPLGKVATWWYDVRREAPTQEPRLDYVADGQAQSRLQCTIPSTLTLPLPVQFAIGPAMLYIGLDPFAGTVFSGTMEGVLIDPTDSKPPN